MDSHQPAGKCQDVLSLLSEYLNLELPPGACQEIETHLAGCTPCEEFADSLRKTVEICQRYQPDELPAGLGQEARARLLEADQKMLEGRTNR